MFFYPEIIVRNKGMAGGTVVKKKKKSPPANAGDIGDMGLIPGLVRSPGGGNDKPLQYSCLENSIDRGVWQNTVHGVVKSWTRLNMLVTLWYVS